MEQTDYRQHEEQGMKYKRRKNYLQNCPSTKSCKHKNASVQQAIVHSNCFASHMQKETRLELLPEDRNVPKRNLCPSSTPLLVLQWCPKSKLSSKMATWGWKHITWSSGEPSPVQTQDKESRDFPQDFTTFTHYWCGLVHANTLRDFVVSITHDIRHCKSSVAESDMFIVQVWKF